MRQLCLTRKNILIACLLILFGTSFHIDNQKIKLRNDPDQMEREILQSVPIGSSIVNADKVMKGTGFHCDYTTNTTYSRRRKPVEGSIEAKTIRYKASDILFCETTKYYIIAYTKWSATIAFKNDLVTNIVVSIDSAGP